MAKISELADGGNLLNDDELIVLRAGGNVRATVANLPEVDASGNQSFADNEKAIFGTGSDLQIYHDGSHSYIDDAGTGLLRLRSNTVYLEKYTGELLADFNADGYVSLLHDNSEKFRTTSTGIDVTGTATMDGLTVQTAQGDITIPTSTSSLNFARAGANYIRATDAAGSFHFVTGANDFATTRLRISANGDVALFEDTGTTPKLFWDSSAESLGIGTSSPSGALDIGGQHVLNDNYDALGASFTRNGAYGSVLSLGRQGVSSGVTLDYPADNTFALSTNGTERMRIDSVGNVGIGTSSPTEPLEVSRLGGSFTYPALDGNTVGFLHCGAGAATSGSQLALGAGNAGQSALVFADTDSPNVGRLLYDHTSNFMQFRVNGDEAMRIDSAGQVGIGTDSPSNALTVVDSTSYGQLRLSSSDADATIKYSALSFGQYAAAEEGYAGILGFSNSTENRIAIGGSTGLLNAATAIQFFTAASATTTTGSEAMRIDSSQNVLVGKTSVNQFTTAGHELHEDGLYVGTRDSGNVAVLNRETNDGSILQFRKDNLTVGSINSTGSGSTISIGGGSSGVYMGGAGVYPTNGSGTLADNSRDLGATVYRWKDLYLSGGAYLGGTAAANKLDDYEEGTFTPSFSGGDYTFTYNKQKGSYTKIGNRVFVDMLLYIDSSTAPSGTTDGDLSVTGLPFTFNAQNTVDVLAVSIGFKQQIANAEDSLSVRFQSGNTEFKIHKDLSTGFPDMTLLQASDLTADSRLRIQFSYPTNS